MTYFIHVGRKQINVINLVYLLDFCKTQMEEVTLLFLFDLLVLMYIILVAEVQIQIVVNILRFDRIYAINI